MKSIIEKRDIVGTENPPTERGYSDDHRVRRLVPPGNWEKTDPFLLLMEDWFPAGVFDRHPHRGIETVTYVIEGTIEHYDNHGHKGTVGAGDALWLTAGRGLIHNEVPGNGQSVHILQLWINLPRTDKLVPAHFQELKGDEMPVRRESGAEIRVFSGTSGEVTAPTINHAPVTMVELRLEPNASIAQELPGGFNGFAVVLGGDGTIGKSSKVVKVNQVAWLTPSVAESAVEITAGDEGLRALLFAGRPLREPVAARGPFVMNTDEELAAGFAEYRSQGERFGL